MVLSPTLRYWVRGPIFIILPPSIGLPIKTPFETGSAVFTRTYIITWFSTKIETHIIESLEDIDADISTAIIICNPYSVVTSGRRSKRDLFGLVWTIHIYTTDVVPLTVNKDNIPPDTGAHRLIG